MKKYLLRYYSRYLSWDFRKQPENKFRTIHLSILPYKVSARCFIGFSRRRPDKGILLKLLYANISVLISDDNTFSIYLT